MRPLPLPPNQLHRFYRGGERIAAFRGTASDDDHAPEEWVGSVTTAHGEETVGLSRLADGRTVREAVASDRDAFLGPGVDEPGVLVKLLDAGERLPVHVHPTDEYALRELGQPRGKTEAWLILEGGEVGVGWRRDVARDELEDWVDRQDVEAMLGELNTVRVEAGDAVFVPARVAHAIGEGVFMVEVQQPSDLSVLLEWKRFADDDDGATLGLGWERALDAVELGARDPEPLLRGRGEVRRGVDSLLPAEADAFFRAERVRGGAELDAAFSVLVGIHGEGSVGGTPLRRGDTLLVPYAAGACRVEGDVEAIRCLR